MGTDSYGGSAKEFEREAKPEDQNHGVGAVLAVEGLVECFRSTAPSRSTASTSIIAECSSKFFCASPSANRS